MDSRLASVHTAMPGVIETYDADTQRAVVDPSPRVLIDGGDPVERPPLVNVPVIFPGGGGVTLALSMQPGDPVLLIVSERGIGPWKEMSTPGDYTPPRSRFFSLADAFALPISGKIAPTDAAKGGIPGASLQDSKATIHISLTDSGLLLEVPRGKSVHLGGDGGEELLRKSFLTAYNSHTHATAMGPSGPPLIQSPSRAPNTTTKTKAE